MQDKLIFIKEALTSLHFSQYRVKNSFSRITPPSNWRKNVDKFSYTFAK